MKSLKLYMKINNFLLNPGLYIVSTPIGNLEDISSRALKVLNESHAIFCEDTRRSLKLLNHYKINKSLYPCHKFNERKISEKIIQTIKKGKIVSLISDAGTPSISDPGQIVVNSCLNNNIDVIPIPGPSAVNSAVSISGFDEKYLFYGFLPKKKNEINKVLQELSNLNFSIVFFAPTHSVNNYLSYFKKFFHERKILIAKEMTKKFESFYRGNIKDIKTFDNDIKGEFTIVISNKKVEKNNSKKIDESVKIKIKNLLKKYSTKDVVEIVSKTENLPKNAIYKICLTIIKKLK